LAIGPVQEILGIDKGISQFSRWAKRMGFRPCLNKFFVSFQAYN